MKNTTALKAACIGLLASPLLVMSEPANAATNGQQIKVETASPFATVTVRGKNQNNQQVHRTVIANNLGDAYTSNHWWKGNVTVTVIESRRSLSPSISPSISENNINTVLSLRSRTCSRNIPTFWPINWFTVVCKL